MDLTKEAHHPGLVYESDRLGTYGGFSKHCPVRPEMLARAGFSFTGPGSSDKVVCFYCDQRLKMWSPGDDPWEEHARYSPRCTFLHVMKGSEYVQHVLRKFNMQPVQHSFQSGGGPLYPDYAFEADRLLTYRNGTFPASCPVRPKALASAGLFYRDDRDQVWCFSCGQTLRSWEPGDDPWEEHTKFHPSCQFVQVMKGGKYVQEILRKHGLVTSSTSNRPVFSTPLQPTAPVLPSAPESLPNTGRTTERSLREEIRQLKEEKVCKVCLDRKVSMAFSPCGHVSCCDECARAVLECPICRARIVGRAMIFLA